MRFWIRLTDSAVEDLNHFRKRERQIIADETARQLMHNADVENRNRKPLRPNPLAQWELRIGDYRVFYDLAEGNVVKVVAVGCKQHNDLFIRGKKVEL